MTNPPLIYCAGKYTDELVYKVHRNIEEARYWAQEICRIGGYGIAPHAITMHFEGLQDYDFYAAANLSLMRRCDAVFLIPNWLDSNGAVNEYHDASRLAIPILYTLEDVMAFVKDWPHRT